MANENLTGKESKFAFNAFGFETEDRNGDPMVMVAIFNDDNYEGVVNTRTGWLRYSNASEQLTALLSSEEKDVLGTRIKSGARFTIFLDQSPDETEGMSQSAGKVVPRYDTRDVKVVGFETS